MAAGAGRGGPGGRRPPAVAEHRTHALDRIAGFTDAVVAIAITLLVLPLVDIARQYPATASVAALLADNYGEVVGFVVSFLAILRFWSVQRRMFESLVDFDETLVILTALWLLGVAFLPFPTARLFTESHLRTDATQFYLGVMGLVSLLGLAQAAYVLRRPALRRPGSTGSARRRVRAGAAACLVFAAAIVTALFVPAAGLLMLVLLGVVRRLGAAGGPDSPGGG